MTDADSDGWRSSPTIREEYYAGRTKRSIKPWEYPDCPRCDTEIYVRFQAGTGRRFECKKCEEPFLPSKREIKQAVETDRNVRVRRKRRARKG